MISSVLPIAILAASSWSRAEPTAYEFKTGSPPAQEFREELKFKTSEGPAKPTPEPKESTANPLLAETEANSTTLFKVPLGYPKKEFLFSYNPGFNGFKNELSGTRTYNYGGGNPLNVSVGYRYNWTASDFLTLEANLQSVSIPEFSDTAAGLKIKDSSVSIWSLGFRGNFSCKFYESALHKLCPAYQLTLDSFPSLEIPQNTNVQMELTGVRDMAVGIGALYSRPFVGEMAFLGQAFFDYGTGIGQSSNLGTRRNQKLSAEAGLEWPLSGKTSHMSASGRAEYRTAQMRSAQDEWNITNLSYAAKLGIRWELGNH